MVSVRAEERAVKAEVGAGVTATSWSLQGCLESVGYLNVSFRTLAGRDSAYDLDVESGKKM